MNKIKILPLFLGLLLMINSSVSWATTCGSISMTAGSGATGSISCQAYGPKNIKVNKNTEVITVIGGISFGSLPANNTVLAKRKNAGQSGDFDFSNGNFTIDSDVWTNWSSIYIAIKNGNSNSGGGWGLFELDEIVSDGVYQTKINGNPVTSISHYFVIGGTAVTNVPVPAALWLFGSGLIGLARISRKKNLKA